jgi:hypothetical protein
LAFQRKRSWLFFRDKIHVTFDMPGRDVNSYHLVGQKSICTFKRRRRTGGIFWLQIHVTFDMPGRDVNSYHLVGQRAFGLSRGEEELVVFFGSKSTLLSTCQIEMSTHFT